MSHVGARLWTLLAYGKMLAFQRNFRKLEGGLSATFGPCLPPPPSYCVQTVHNGRTFSAFWPPPLLHCVHTYWNYSPYYLDLQPIDFPSHLYSCTFLEQGCNVLSSNCRSAYTLSILLRIFDHPDTTFQSSGFFRLGRNGSIPRSFAGNLHFLSLVGAGPRISCKYPSEIEKIKPKGWSDFFYLSKFCLHLSIIEHVFTTVSFRLGRIDVDRPCSRFRTGKRPAKAWKKEYKNRIKEQNRKKCVKNKRLKNIYDASFLC